MRSWSLPPPSPASPPAGVNIDYYLGTPPRGDLKLEILDVSGPRDSHGDERGCRFNGPLAARDPAAAGDARSPSCGLEPAAGPATGAKPSLRPARARVDGRHAARPGRSAGAPRQLPRQAHRRRPAFLAAARRSQRSARRRITGDARGPTQAIRPGNEGVRRHADRASRVPAAGRVRSWSSRC